MIEPADVVRAIEANRDRWRELGAGQDGVRGALPELGFVEPLDDVMYAEAQRWARHLPLNASVHDVTELVAACGLHMLAAGVRLGRFTSGEAPSTASDPRDDEPTSA